KLYADEQIVMVAVASEHRQNAFHAAQYIMDFLKTRATLWKKEVGSRGARWIGIKQSDKDAAAAWSDTN
ncbi:MAG: molybdenum cofactor biosynthesis protein MoaE, partial [Arenicella sp.]|nr:molybdenum cofactor biosynthesis protein MoaE [Arenicella sp.]